MIVNNIFEVTSDPLLALALTALATIALGYIVQWLIHRLLIRITERFSTAEYFVNETAAPMRILVPLLLLQMLWLSTPDSWDFVGRIRHITGLLVIGVVTWLIVRCIGAVSDTIVSLRPVTATDNLQARRIQTQARVIARSLMVLAILIGVALALMTFPAVRTVGASLLASAGVAGIVAGVAARPVLSNMIAGLQIAITQPLRIDDVLIIDGEWGRVEEIAGSYVVLAIWDQRRLIIPLQWFIEHPFQNWTRSTSQLLGSVMLWVDYGVPLDILRKELERVCENASEWDRRVCNLQVVETSERAMQVRALVSAMDSGRAWDLRCHVREGLLKFLQKNYPQYLPRIRNTVEDDRDAVAGLHEIAPRDGIRRHAQHDDGSESVARS